MVDTSDINVTVEEAEAINVTVNDICTVPWGGISGTLSNQTDLQSELDLKVDKVSGKGLSTNDYTDDEKTKLSEIEAGAEVNNISDVNATDLTDAGDSSLHYHSADRNRANHTGTQTASTISDFDTEVSNNSSVTANTAKITVVWSEVTTTSQSASVNHAYITNNASQVNVTLPSSASIGDIVRVVGLGSGGWKLSQNASQYVYFGNLTSTTGTGGYLESTNEHDSIELVCVSTNGWSVISSIGNITIA